MLKIRKIGDEKEFPMRSLPRREPGNEKGGGKRSDMADAGCFE